MQGPFAGRWVGASTEWVRTAAAGGAAASAWLGCTFVTEWLTFVPCCWPFRCIAVPTTEWLSLLEGGKTTEINRGKSGKSRHTAHNKSPCPLGAVGWNEASVLYPIFPPTGTRPAFLTQYSHCATGMLFFYSFERLTCARFFLYFPASDQPKHDTNWPAIVATRHKCMVCCIHALAVTLRGNVRGNFYARQTKVCFINWSVVMKVILLRGKERVWMFLVTLFSPVPIPVRHIERGFSVCVRAVEN